MIFDSAEVTSGLQLLLEDASPINALRQTAAETKTMNLFTG